MADWNIKETVTSNSVTYTTDPMGRLVKREFVGQWVCPICGRVNASTVVRCPCEEVKIIDIGELK